MTSGNVKPRSAADQIGKFFACWHARAPARYTRARPVRTIVTRLNPMKKHVRKLLITLTDTKRRCPMECEKSKHIRHT